MYYSPYPNYGYMPTYTFQGNSIQHHQQMNPYYSWQQRYGNNYIQVRDYGGNPFVVNIEDVTEHNRIFRTALWTGEHLQVTLMSLGIGEDIGLEVHPNTDQFLRIEDGHGFVQMGNSRNNLTFERRVSEDDAIMVPAGTWHNITNTGNEPLKLYTIYAPPEHPFGTIHHTKSEAMAAENNY